MFPGSEGPRRENGLEGGTPRWSPRRTSSLSIVQPDVSITRPKRGDIVAVCTTGAYNFSMASNYNRVPRPPVVFIGENGPYIAVRRETLDDLLNYDC